MAPQKGGRNGGSSSLPLVALGRGRGERKEERGTTGLQNDVKHPIYGSVQAIRTADKNESTGREGWMGVRVRGGRARREEVLLRKGGRNGEGEEGVVFVYFFHVCLTYRTLSKKSKLSFIRLNNGEGPS